jgi:hypothetical protein
MSDEADIQVGRPAKPFYLDEFTRKHESYVYGESAASVLEIEHEGRFVRLLMPHEPLPVRFRVSSIKGDFLFAIGDQLDFEDEDGRIIEGGDGVLAVGVKLADRSDTYSALAWHNLFEYTLKFLDQYQSRDRIREA